MPFIINVGKFLVDSPAKVGDLGLRLDGLAYQRTPILPEGISAWSYVVPTGNKLTLKGLTLSLENGAIQGAAQTTVFNAGVIKLRVAGADKLEMRLHSWPVMGITIGGEGTSVYGVNYCNRFDFGDGLIFTDAEPFQITITPVALNLGAMFIATIFASIAGIPTILKGTLVWSTITANQPIISYTPEVGNDITVYGLTVEVVCSGSVILNGGRLTLNGLDIFEFGPIGMDQTISSFFGGDNPIIQGGLHFFPEEIEFQQGDKLELFVHPVLNLGHTINILMAGELTAYGGGGGGTGISRSRIVARS